MNASQETESDPSQPPCLRNLDGPNGMLQETPSGLDKSSIENDSSHTQCYPLEAPAPLIARLPPEMLARIFEEGHAESYTKFSHAVSSVCRYWRAVALGTSSLWSPIIFDALVGPNHANLGRLYLARSQNSPLKIFVHCENMESFWNDLVPHLSRVRSLIIDDYSSEDRDMSKRIWRPLESEGIFPSQNERASPVSSLDTHSMGMVHAIGAPGYNSLQNVTRFWFAWLPVHIGGSRSRAVWGPGDTPIETCLSQIIVAMPKLRELKLMHGAPGCNRSPVPLLDKLPASLEQLVLWCFPVAWDLEFGDWRGRDLSRVHTMELMWNSSRERPFDTDMFSLLEMMPDLKDLCIRSLEIRRDPNKPIWPLHLHNLETLSLDTCTAEVFLHHLSAPALTKAELSDRDALAVGHGADVAIPALWQSCPLLESLTLSDGCTLSSNERLVGVLRDFLKNVKRLEVYAWGATLWDDGLLTGLATYPWACPSLEEIHITNSNRFTQDALENFVRARKRGSLASECAAIRVIGIERSPTLSATATLTAMVQYVQQ